MNELTLLNVAKINFHVKNKSIKQFYHLKKRIHLQLIYVKNILKFSPTIRNAIEEM